MMTSYQCDVFMSKLRYRYKGIEYVIYCLNSEKCGYSKIFD